MDGWIDKGVHIFGFCSSTSKDLPEAVFAKMTHPLVWNIKLTQLCNPTAANGTTSLRILRFRNFEEGSKQRRRGTK